MIYKGNSERHHWQGGIKIPNPQYQIDTFIYMGRYIDITNRPRLRLSQYTDRPTEVVVLMSILYTCGFSVNTVGKS